jgi:hypothetical protein
MDYATEVEMCYGLSKYEMNNIKFVMAIQFVNFIHYVKNCLKIINSEIIRILGLVMKWNWVAI